eukprot:6213246-Pleurochrysis_carterae.AAC.2
MPHPSYEDLMARDLQIRREEDFAPMVLGTFAAVLWRKQAGNHWERCVLLRKDADNFEVWNATGINLVESYVYGRDEDGELLDDSVEEEFSLTLAPPSWLARPVAPKPSAVPMPAPIAPLKPAERTIVDDCVRAAMRDVLLRVDQTFRVDPTPPKDSQSDMNVPTSNEVLHSLPTHVPPEPVPPVPTADKSLVKADLGKRYSLNGRHVYAWSSTETHVGVVFDSYDAGWVSIPRSQFESNAQLLSAPFAKGAVQGVVMQRLSPKGAKCPAATLQDKVEVFGADADGK